MFRLLFQYVLVPIIALLLICYAAIPLWVPSIVVMLLKPYNWQEIELNVGYPSHESWHIKQVSWHQIGMEGNFTATLKDVSLAYTWQSINNRHWPYFSVGEASASIETNPTDLPLMPVLALIPSQWLLEWPQFKVHKFELDLVIQGQQFDLSGQHTNQTERLSI